MREAIAAAGLAPYVKAALIFTGVAGAGWLLERLLLGRLQARALRTAWKWDDLLVRSIRGPALWWAVLLGLHLALEGLDLPKRVEGLIDRAAFSLVIISLIVIGTRLTTGVLKDYTARVPSFPKTSLIINIANGIVITVGALVLLHHLGVSIAPVLTALGVGGLAVALALQDTLANFFSGLYITLARKIRKGDYVRLETGQEGYVDDIGWRQTTLRELPGNLIIVPNNRLAQAIATNYNLPASDLAVLVNLGVSYASDLAKVERVTVEMAREVMRTVEGGVPEFEPFIRYNAFGDFSIDFTVIMRGRDFVAQHIIRHEFIKRIHERYAREGIEIPFPVRTVHVRQAGG
ncbi:MAG: mechanosensitive ion channel family protein [Nitrospirae bacterium]|nr:mechanosensitive ion channel family protein [Nitrospirota bacterium]